MCHPPSLFRVLETRLKELLTESSLSSLHGGWDTCCCAVAAVDDCRARDARRWRGEPIKNCLQVWSSTMQAPSHLLSCHTTPTHHRLPPCHTAPWSRVQTLFTNTSQRDVTSPHDPFYFVCAAMPLHFIKLMSVWYILYTTFIIPYYFHLKLMVYTYVCIFMHNLKLLTLPWNDFMQSCWISCSWKYWQGIKFGRLTVQIETPQIKFCQCFLKYYCNGQSWV